MLFKKTSFLLLLLAAITLNAQKNFTYTPEKPKPGDLITFTYEPAGDIANTLKPTEAAVRQFGKNSSKADDLILEKKAGKYVGSFQADTAMSFIFLVFSSDKKVDNNFNDGYTILLYENAKPRNTAYLSLSNFYQYMGRQAGVEVNNEKALEALKKEFELYPESKKENIYNFVRLQTLVNINDAQAIVQKEIESFLKSGLNEEIDYTNLENLYRLAKLPEQQKWVSSIKKEK